MAINHFELPTTTNVRLIDKIEGVYIAEGAKVIGNVSIGKFSSLWYNSVVRGDINRITIGEKTNVQDNSVIHIANDQPTIIGDNVTIGHNAIIHGCTIEDGVLIGMGAIILNGAVIQKGSVIAAGTLIKEKEVVPPFSLYVGVPGRKIKALSEESYNNNLGWAEKYYQLSLRHQKK